MKPALLSAFGGYGVELEYMIVDARTLAVRPIAATLLAALEAETGMEAVPGLGWSNELVCHLVEVKNLAPHADLALVAEGINAEVARANRLLAPLDARLMPTGMHPWMNPRAETHLWTGEAAEIYSAYHRIFDCCSHGWANVQAMHLNLPFAGDGEFARLHSAVRLVTPLVPAIAASSPIMDGVPAASLDARVECCTTNSASLPSVAGSMIPEPVGTREEYERTILGPMYREIAPLDPAGVLQREWLNSRAAIARFDRSAIEMRAFDVQECPCADLAIAVAVAGAVRRCYDAGRDALEAQQRMPTARLAAILARCTAVGEEAVIDDAEYLAVLGFAGTRCTARELWVHLLAECEPCHQAPWRRPLQIILEQGPLARRILRAAGPNPSRERLAAIYATLCDCLAECRIFEGVREKAQ